MTSAGLEALVRRPNRACVGGIWTWAVRGSLDHSGCGREAASEVVLPEISRFFGIVIAMFYKDHNPPHFHAYHGAHEAAIGIRDGAVLWGDLPARALRHVQEWRMRHLRDLEEDWERARRRQTLEPIAPLE